jgi:hypothetical protein
MSDHKFSVVHDDPIGAPQQGSLAAVMAEVKKIAGVVQSQGATQLLIYSEVQSVRADMKALSRAINLRQHPAFLWFACVLGTLAVGALLWIAYRV